MRQTYNTASTSISLDRGQTLTDGGWSTLESIILIQVICFIERELMDLETATILMVYNTTVEYALSPYCSLAVHFVKESKISLLKLIVIHSTTLHFTNPAALLLLLLKM